MHLAAACLSFITRENWLIALIKKDWPKLFRDARVRESRKMILERPLTKSQREKMLFLTKSLRRHLNGIYLQEVSGKPKQFVRSGIG